MACKECEERRRKLLDAILRGKMAEATGHAVAGLRQMVGLKTEGSAAVTATSGNVATTSAIVGESSPEAIAPEARSRKK